MANQEYIDSAELMSTNQDYYVVMANELLKSKSKLSLNSAKLIRSAIMQIKPEDTELKPYKITIQEFNELLGLKSKTNIYRDVIKILDELFDERIEIKDEKSPKDKWKKLRWVITCERDKQWILIQLHPDIRQYVLGLQKMYTQYELGYILSLKSVYAIRLFELIKMGLSEKDLYKYKEVQVEVMLDVLRRATDTEDKFERISSFKEKVIDVAIRDINNVPLGYRIKPDYKPIKYGKKIIGFEFTVSSWSSELPPPDEKTQRKIEEIKRKQQERREEEQEQIRGQMSLDDYI